MICFLIVIIENVVTLINYLESLKDAEEDITVVLKIFTYEIQKCIQIGRLFI